MQHIVTSSSTFHADDQVQIIYKLYEQCTYIQKQHTLKTSAKSLML